MSTQEDNIAWMDATAQAELVQKGEISPIELLEGAIERAEQLNPEINAIINPLYDLAREASKDLPDGPFRGVPFLMKDIGAELAGVKMEEGSRFMRGYVSPEDSELTARFKRAGLNIMGKTNTPEFGLLPTTEPELYGVTRNPWNPELGSGGSSGGACAAVAAGIVPVAHANDGGGSIRIPASCCGLVGLKPTRGRNSLAPAGDMANGIVHEHVVCRSVRDSAGLLDATHGPMPGDPYFPPPPVRPYVEEVGRDSGKLRIAFSSTPLTEAGVSDEVRGALEATAKLCEDLGHHVEEASPEIDRRRALKAFGRVWVGMLGWAIGNWEKKLGRTATEADFEPLTWTMYQSNNRLNAAQYLGAIEDLQAMSREIAELFNDYDVWLTPTLCRDPVPLNYFDFTAETRDEHIR
ncbi:MAG: amidase, partial [Alphaproteobacteria bacterium]|nr:amidase [Alphaproteobacteria bacterium]